MKRIYLIIGEGNTGKSTLLRCLTGIRQMGRPDVMLTNMSTIHIWCWMRSLQEMTPPMSPATLIHEITQPSEDTFIDYLVPLRIKAMYSYQGIDAYLQALQAHPNITIVNAVALGVDETEYNTLATPFPPSIPAVYISRSRNHTANENAHTVRTAWGWL